MSSKTPQSGSGGSGVDRIDSRRLYEDQKLLDLLEKRSAEKDREYRELYKRSHVMQNQQSQQTRLNQNRHQMSDGVGESSDESELDNLVKRIKKVETAKAEARNYTYKDVEFYHNFIRNNLDLASNLMLEISTLLVCYPFNTVKTRIQARHPLEDVSFFVKNNVAKFSLYRGIGQSMLSTFSGVFVNNAAFRWASLSMAESADFKSLSTFQKQLIAFTFADLFATPFRLPFEVRKVFLQMNSTDKSFNHYMKCMRQTLLPSLMRDLSFRIGFNSVFQLCLHGQSYVEIMTTQDVYQKQLLQRNIDRSVPTQKDYNKRITGMILGSLVGILLSNPFDLVVTRLASQQYPKYSGFYNCLKTVVREEKPAKLFFSGYLPRSAYYMISGSIIFNSYDVFRSMIAEAYVY